MRIEIEASKPSEALAKATAIKRAALRLSQQDLATAAKCHKNTIYKIESGSIIPSFDIATAIIAALKFSDAEILSLMRVPHG